jgi:hypothetical protein
VQFGLRPAQVDAAQVEEAQLAQVVGQVVVAVDDEGPGVDA